jgi:glycogen operon protein
MLSGGDEVGRTQQGNNNAYCQDSALSWTPWDGHRDEGFLAFVRRMIALRRTQPVLRRRTFLGRTPDVADVVWLRPDGAPMGEADWVDPERRAMAAVLDGQAIAELDARGQRITGDTLWLVFNGQGEDVAFHLPPGRGDLERWERLVDTDHPDGPAHTSQSGETWTMTARSAAAFRLVR